MRSKFPWFSHLSRLACGAALLLSCSSDSDAADDETSGDTTSSTGPTTGAPTSTTTNGSTTNGSTTQSDTTGPGETTESSDGTTDGGDSTGDTSDGTTGDGTTEDGTTTEESGGMATTGQSGVSYHQDAQPIYANYCSPCHAGQSAGGHNLATSYADAFTASAVCNGLNKAQCSIVRIQNGSMPPGDVCTGDPAQDAGNTSCLTAAEQATIADWIDDGLLP